MPPSFSVPPRVLVVDADPIERAAAQTQLADFASVDVAHDVDTAVAHAKAAKPDIVVADASLFEALRPLITGMPFVVLTPGHAIGFELRALERGAIDAIAKPVAHSPLRTRVRTHLRARSLSNELRVAASTDALTGLANRRAFFGHMNDEHERCIQHQRAMHLLLVELDDLVALTERHGHKAGDACLMRVARAVKQNVREDDVVARVDEARIAVLLSESTTRGAAIVARRLAEAVSALAIRNDVSRSGVVTVSVVIGYVAPALDGARPAARLIAETERALAMSKDGERGQVWFYDVAS